MKKIICATISITLIFGSWLSGFSHPGTNEIAEYLRNLEVGRPFNYRNLTIIPIYAKTFRDRSDYLTLDEAVKKGQLIITELNGGRVPQVKITNKSNHYILLVAGEILTGCKQDRLVAADVLIGPHSKNIILPVYCSEHGRWIAKSQNFASEDSNAEPMLRGMVYSKGSQSAVWERISQYTAKMGISSRTEALQDTYRHGRVKEKMREYVDKLECIPRLEEDAVGVVVGLGDDIIGIDTFVNPSLFARFWPKLLRSYVALAICEEEQKGTLSQQQAKDMFNEVYRASFSRQPGVDLGEELKADLLGMICSALVYRAEVIHLGLFPGEKELPITPLHPERLPLIE